ncbi:MAG: CAP domain-containing protein [Flavobacteriaceae bacterium]|tara:strand:+ start:8783 stop:9268 length:486 start_codon:yes stop_codon:yes gene_type:complete
MKNFYPKAWFIIACFTVLTFTISCSKDDSQENIEKQEANSISNEILQLVNAHRVNLGKAALSKNDLATQLAEEHSKYMVDQNEISHDNSDKRGLRLINEEQANKVGENVAYKYKNAEEVMEAWLNSSGHKKNIEADYTHIGIGAVKNDVGIYYFTQVFFRK